MSSLTLNLDKQAQDTINDLRRHYNASSDAEVIRRALSLLKMASVVEKSHGELLIRKGTNERRVIA
jgi:hypothetical protein